MASEPHRPNRPVPSFRRLRPGRTLIASLGDELVYQTLGPDMTRLVILKRSQPGNLDIHVDVIQVPFSELGKDAYACEALSYHWGTGEPENPNFLCKELPYLHETYRRGSPASHAADATSRFLQNNNFSSNRISTRHSYTYEIRIMISKFGLMLYALIRTKPCSYTVGVDSALRHSFLRITTVHPVWAILYNETL